MQAALDSCAEAAGAAEIERYGGAASYADDAECLKVTVSGMPRGALRLCLELPVLGCTVIFVQNTSIDVWLPKTSDIEQLVSLTSCSPDRDAANAGRSLKFGTNAVGQCVCK